MREIGDLQRIADVANRGLDPFEAVRVKVELPSSRSAVRAASNWFNRSVRS